MEWQQLEYFLTVAEYEHFTKAAERLAISQPALSRAIAKLEEEIGVALFDRLGRTVRLNAFGRIFLKHVECGFKEIKSGMEEIRQLNDPFTGTISVAFLLTLGFNFLPDLIGKFNRQYPNVQFRLYQNATPFILKALYSGEVDFCFVGPFDRQPGVVWNQLMIEELFIYLPVEHHLAGRKSLELKELTGEPFISLKRSYGMRTLMEQFAREAGFIPTIRFEGDDVATVMGLVSCGLGVTLLPMFTSYDSSKVVRIPVTSPRCERAIGLAWLEGRTFSRSAELFRDFAIEQFK